MLIKMRSNLMSSRVTLTVGGEGIDFYTNQDVFGKLPCCCSALHNEFREAAEKKVTLPDDGLEDIAAVFEFLATGNYTSTYRSHSGAVETKIITPTAPCDLTEGSFHLRVYTTTFKFDCQGLVSVAMESLIDVCNSSMGLILSSCSRKRTQGMGYRYVGQRGDMDAVKQKLPGILQHVYAAHGQEMQDIACECAVLTNDMLCLSVVTRPK